MKYFVRMLPTKDTYIYEVVRHNDDGTYETAELDYLTARNRWPQLISNAFDALVTLQEHGFELFDNAPENV